MSQISSFCFYFDSYSFFFYCFFFFFFFFLFFLFFSSSFFYIFFILFFLFLFFSILPLPLFFPSSSSSSSSSSSFIIIFSDMKEYGQIWKKLFLSINSCYSRKISVKLLLFSLIECTQDTRRCFFRLSDSRKSALYGIAKKKR